jgi:hypothetical protein
MNYLLINLLYPSLDDAINSLKENGLPNLFAHSDYYNINYDWMRL